MFRALGSAALQWAKLGPGALRGGAMRPWLSAGAAIGKTGGLAAHAFLGGALGSTGRAALYGGALGAGYGAFSDNTSVLGGALAGAGLGAAGLRYGMPGVRGAMSRWNTAAGSFASGAYRRGMSTLGAAGGRAVRSAVLFDARRIQLMGNRAYNRIQSSMKGWTGGITPF